jgi:hypothetical protein
VGLAPSIRPRPKKARQADPAWEHRNTAAILFPLSAQGLDDHDASVIGRIALGIQ